MRLRRTELALEEYDKTRDLYRAPMVGDVKRMQAEIKIAAEKVHKVYLEETGNTDFVHPDDPWLRALIAWYIATRCPNCLGNGTVWEQDPYVSECLIDVFCSCLEGRRRQDEEEEGLQSPFHCSM